jgi:hypothetical protein
MRKVWTAVAEGIAACGGPFCVSRVRAIREPSLGRVAGHRSLHGGQPSVCFLVDAASRVSTRHWPHPRCGNESQKVNAVQIKAIEFARPDAQIFIH